MRKIGPTFKSQLALMLCLGSYTWRIVLNAIANDGTLNEDCSLIPMCPINICNFRFSTWCPIYSPHTRPSEAIITNKASIERQTNRLSSGIYYLTWMMNINPCTICKNKYNRSKSCCVTFCAVFIIMLKINLEVRFFVFYFFTNFL